MSTEVSADPREDIDVACLEPFRQAAGTVEEALEHDLVTPLREGLAAHRIAIDSIGLSGEAPATVGARIDALLEYRRVVVNALLEPLQDSLGQRGPAGAIWGAYSAALQQSWAATRALPKTLSVPWKEQALAVRPTDGLGRRVGKFFARGLSAARKPGRERSLPVRSVASRFAERVAVPEMDDWVVESLGASSRWTGELERAWTEWGDSALPALVDAEHADEERFVELWSEVRDAANQLQTGLETLLEEPPFKHEAGIRRVDTLRAALDADVAVAGSFLLGASEHSGPSPKLKRAERAAATNGSREAGVEARMRLLVALLSILAGATGVQRRLIARFQQNCVEPVRGLRSSADDLEALIPGVESPLTVEGLERVNVQFRAVLEPAVALVPDPRTVNETVQSGADSTVEALFAMVRQAPVEIELREGGRRVEIRPVAVQDLARQSFDALRIERVRASPGELIGAVETLRTGVAALEGVFQFAHDAAVLELESEEPEAESRAAALVQEGLKSIAESMRQEVRTLEGAVELARARLAAEICEGSKGLVDRVAAGRVQAQLLAARSRAADMRAWVNERLGPPVDRAFRKLVRRSKRLARFVTRGFHRGTEMVAGPTAGQAAGNAFKELVDRESVIEGLPLVYQRLFAPDALSEPTLLAGRTAELTDAMSRWKRWQSHDGVPVLIQGRQGSGTTSLLNVVCAQIEGEGARVLRLALAARITDEGRLSETLATGFGLPPARTLTALAAAVFASPPEELPQAVGLDNLEHLYLRAPHGTNLIERLLTFMAETEPRVFWMGAITTSALQLVSTAEPTAISQVDILDVKPLGTAETREAVLLRHGKSGLPLRYEEPQTGRRMLRHRLRRMRDQEGYRRLLEDDFFDRLSRATSGDLRLALHKWLESSDFDTGDGLLMRSPERPDFSVLDTLNLTQNLTLKAFLEHRTLSIDEHDRIFRLPRQESYQIFESLGNRHIITTVRGTENSDPTGSEAEEDLRYEVQPLLIGAVISHLRSRNIVH